MSSLYLHVGPHKTGSTYLQALLGSNTDVLKQHNIIYPKNVFYAAGQHTLRKYYLANDFGKEFQDGVTYLNSLKEDIILSSENFMLMKKEHFEKLKDDFPNKDIKIIFYFRNPSKRLISDWQETVKHGNTRSFFEYSTNHFFKPLSSNKLNLVLFLTEITNVFGKDNLYLIDYDTAKKNNSMMQEFNKVIGHDNLILDADKSVNKMRDLFQIEILRYMNQRAANEGKLNTSNIRELFDKKLKTKEISIDSIEKYFKKYYVTLSLGNTMADRSLYNLIKKRFHNRFINQISIPSETSYKIISDRWVFDNKIKKLAEETYQELMS